MTTLRSIEFLDLLLKHEENAARGVAVLYLDREWVRKKILLCASFVRFQCIIENYLKVVGLVGGRCGCSVSVGHNGENEEFVHAERTAGSWEWNTSTVQTLPREFENTCHPERPS
jgi:hypothetical protein